MSTLKVRQLKVDLSQGFPRHWLGNDAFRSHLFNAQSLSFPAGEQFFIDSLRAAIPLIKDDKLKQDIQGFIGQEATHRFIHAKYNEELVKQGHAYFIEPWMSFRIRNAKHLSEVNNLAVTMAYEHFTAIFADAVLGEAQWASDAAEPLKTLWSWHSAEETEHKAVAFDVYHAIGGGYARRIAWFVYVTILFSIDTFVQTAHCLYRDKQLFRWITLKNAFHFYFKKNGFLRFSLPQFMAFFHPKFHPMQHNNVALAEKWLAEHSDDFYAR